MIGLSFHAVSAAALRLLLRGVFALAIGVFLMNRAWGADATFTATLDRSAVAIGSAAQLTFTVENGSPTKPPVLPPLPNAQVNGPATGRMDQMMVTPTGVQRVSRLTYTYSILPLNAGTITIPAVEVVVDNRRLKSQPLTLSAIASAPGAQPGAAAVGTDGQAKAVFLTHAATKTNVFLGEMVPVDIKFYVANSAVDPRILQLPQLGGDGFTMGRVVQIGQSREIINGIPYTAVACRSSVMATKAGPIQLGPLTMEVQIPDPTRADMFGRMPMVRTSIKSEPVPIHVQPLPTNAPDGFNGAVGNFRLALEASPTNVLVGDPITLRIQIAGKGNLEMIRLPEQPTWRDFQRYEPTSRYDVETLGLEGTAFFEWVVAPQNAAIAALPPLVFSFFNPDTRAYETLRSAAVPLTVRATTEAQPSVAANAPKAEGQTVELAHIRPTLGQLSAPTVQLLEQPWFWWLNAVAPAGWLVTVGLRRRREAHARDPELGRRKNVSKRVRAGLAELEAHAKNDAVEPFFATVFRLLQEQIGERLRLPASGITESVIDERLRAKGVPEELLARCHELFQACNNARYAGHQTSAELASWIPKLEATLADLQKVK